MQQEADEAKPMNRTLTEANSKKSLLGYSRLYDNHFDNSVHNKAWIAPGKGPEAKFNHDDSGLGYQVPKPHKLRNFKEKHELDQEIKRKYGSVFRHFKEYDNLRNNEILVTIEYCTNCKQHQSSTKHDEEKYYSFAVRLKQEILAQYPIVKILLKPLLFNPTDQSIETMHLRTRIGAFEVQIAIKNAQGQQTQATLFSKLTVRTWPDVAAVVEGVSNYMPKDDFVVRLLDRNNSSPTLDSHRDTNEDSPQKGDSKLQGIKVRLTPHRISRMTGNETERSLDIRGASFTTGGRPTSGQSLRPISAQQRPKSAYSSISAKSYGSLGQSIGGSGDLRRPASASMKPKRQFMIESDAFGMVVFKGIPHDVYECEVVENKNYLPERRLVNLFDRAESGAPFSEDIELREQTLAFCVIKVMESTAYELPVSGAEIQIRKRETHNETKTVILREQDPHTKPGHYEFLIDPGDYVLIATSDGYEEAREEIIARKGENFIKCPMAPLNANVPIKKLIGIAAQNYENQKKEEERRDIESASDRRKKDGRPGEGPSSHHSIPEESKKEKEVQKEKEQEQRVKKERVQSAQQKNIELYVYDADTREPIANAQVAISEVSLKILTDKEGKCTFPVHRLNKGSLAITMDDYFDIIEEYGQDTLDITSLNKMKFPLIRKPTSPDEYHFRFLSDSEEQEFIKLDVVTNDKLGEENFKIEKKKFFVGLSKVASRNGIYRIVATITNPQHFFNPENKFIVSGSEDYGMIDIPMPPEDIFAAQTIYWDIGLIAAPSLQLIEVNAYSTTLPKATDYLKQYQSLLNFLHNSKSVDFKGIFGFNGKDREVSDGDIFVSLKTIMSSLDKYGFEIEDRKGLAHLLQSARTSREMYSYNVLDRKFSGIQPPFDFIAEDPKHEVVNEEEEDEYLDNFDDDN